MGLRADVSLTCGLVDLRNSVISSDGAGGLLGTGKSEM